MKYILDSSGYIEEISFGASISCNNNTCTEYSGTVPSGYNSLEEWADNANIRAYKIESNNLTYDSSKNTSLESEWTTETANNTSEIQGNKVTSISSSSTNTQYPSAKCVYDAIQGGGGGGGISLLDVYPVGSIYMSVNNTDPSTLFGGTWSAWGSGRVPVGVDTTQTEFDTVEETGGEKTHTLTISEMPSHAHSNDGWVGSDAGAYFNATCNNAGTKYPNSQLTYPTGGSEAHNNLQPYITCYMWKRTA